MTNATTAVRTGPGFTAFDRYLGTCKACRTSFAVTIGGSPFPRDIRPCPQCGKQTAVEQVTGSVSESRRCDARCLNAKRSSCECSCGGENHGAGW